MDSKRLAQWQYGVAWGLFALLLFLTLFGSHLMPHGISDADKIYFTKMNVDGVMKDVAPPYHPSRQFWFGTDHRGYDIVSLLLNGAKYTMGFALAATLLRFLLAVPLGLFVGVTGRLKGALSMMQLVTTAVPTILFLFPMMYGLGKVLQQADADRVLFVMIVLFGVFQVAHPFAERAQFFSGKLYIVAARTMGASTGRIVFKHLVPHLRSELLYAFLTELAQLLFLIGQLAVVKVFLGGGETWVLVEASVKPYKPAVTLQLTNSGEWGSMIAYGIQMLRYYPAILIASVACLAGSILILIYFSKQLQRRIEKPFRYRSIPLWKNKPVLASAGVAALACVLVVTLVPSKAPVAKPAPQVPKATTAMAQPSGGDGDPSEAAKRQAMQEAIKSVRSTADLFMNQLVQNKWAYASAYMVNQSGNQFVLGTPETPKPFDLWMQALAKEHYSYVEVQSVTQEPEESGADSQVPNGYYGVEVQVADAKGQTQMWKLRLVVASGPNGLRSQVVSGSGEPKF